MVAIADEWLLFGGGRCSEVIYGVKVYYETSRWWPLLTDGCYSEVVVSTGLTVPYSNKNLKFRKRVFLNQP